MPVLLPNNYTVVTALGSQWSAVFQIFNDDGTLANITNKVFEFVVRNRVSSVGQALFSVNATPTAYGEIVTTTATSSLQVVVNPAATSLVTEGGGPFTLWMDQNLPDATALVTGTFFAQSVAAA